MSERRMFAKTIIDSDAFLDMPMSTQCLYFHLSMRADDEGFINNPKKISRMVGAGDDDLKVLATKHFIIPFDSGVVVIKHWKIHNYIRGDRLAPTKYQDEMSQLMVKDNGSYSLIEGKMIDSLCNVSAEDLRKEAYSASTLPYSFEYKIKRVFDGATCPMCGCVMHGYDSNRKPSIQHNTPISKGGEHEIDNISIICLHCNTSVRNKETGSLNNVDVIKAWDRITDLDRNNVDWFDNPDAYFADIRQSSVSQLPDKCQHRLGKDSIDKDRLGKDSIESSDRKRFTPPTVDDVTQYAMEMGYKMDANSFVDFYSCKDWMVGKNRMKDWKAAVRNWCRRDRQQPSTSSNPFLEMLERGEFDD